LSRNFYGQDKARLCEDFYGKFHQGVSIFALTIFTGLLQILSELFSLRAGVLSKTWFLERIVSELVADLEM
jgi:hypothetical protein